MDNCSGPPDIVCTEPVGENLAELALRFDQNSADAIALIHCDGTQFETLRRAELYGVVADCAAGLRRLGVGPGDCVMGMVPSIPSAVIMTLAVAAIGAKWAPIPPTEDPTEIQAHRQRLQPVLLVTVDACRSGHRRVNALDAVRSLLAITGDLRVVLIPHSDADAHLDAAVDWEHLFTRTAPLQPLKTVPAPVSELIGYVAALPISAPVRDAIASVPHRLCETRQPVATTSTPPWSPRWFQLVAALAADAGILTGGGAALGAGESAHKLRRFLDRNPALRLVAL
jgi:AMP-binding enzyme